MAMIVPADTRSSWARCGVCRIDRHGSPPPKTVPPGLGPATGPAAPRSALAGPRGAAEALRSAALSPRTADADRVARSVCPYCAVGCGHKVFVKDERVIQ